MKQRLRIYVISIAVFLVISCQKNTNEVVVYSTVDQVFSEPILHDFETETGIHVKAVYDTEETKSTGVLNRIIAETGNPQCDVFWSGDPVRAAVLKNKGLTESYQSVSAEGIDSIYLDPELHWLGFSARARVLIFNKKILSPEELPESIFELTQSQYKGLFTMANPLFGTTTFHIAALFSIMGEKKAKQFMDSLKANEVYIASSNGDVKKRVMTGEFAFGLTDTDDANEAKKESPDVDYLFLGQSDMGCLIMPNTVSLLKNSPNPENGKKMIDYLLSKNTEEKLAVSCVQMPLHKNANIPENVPSLDSITAMNLDYNHTAGNLENVQSFLKSWLDTK